MVTLTTAKESRLIYSIVMDSVDPSLPICLSLAQLQCGLLSQNCLQSVNSIEIMPFLHKHEVRLFKEAPYCGNSLMLCFCPFV